VKKQPNRWLVFFSLAIQIGLLMYLAVQTGNHFDLRYSTSKPWFTLGFCVLALIIILRLIQQQTKKIS